VQVREKKAAAFLPKPAICAATGPAMGLRELVGQFSTPVRIAALK
jgi:hypothetical protein